MADHNTTDHFFLFDGYSGILDDSGGMPHTLAAYTGTIESFFAVAPLGFGTLIITYYKMRALRDPFGTGFVSWVSMVDPDPNGNFAPEPIIPGTAVIMASWIE